MIKTNNTRAASPSFEEKLVHTKAKEILVFSVLIIVGLYFSIVGLIAAKSFLAPLAVAILLAMILIPLSNRFEKWGLGRGWSAFTSVIITIVCFLLLFFAVAVQVENVANDWPKIKEDMKPKIEQLQEWISDKTGIKPAEQEQMVKDEIPGGGSSSGESQGQSGGQESSQGGSGSGNGQSGEAENEQSQQPSGAGQENQPQQQGGQQQSGGGQSAQQGGGSGGGEMMSSAWSFFAAFVSFLANALLAFIYMFFILLYRSKLRKSVLKFLPERKQDKAHSVMQDSIKVSQGYLLGRLLLIGFLIAIYTIGLSISGVKNAFLISVIAAFLSLLPYIGNILGFGLAMGMAAFSGGDMMMFIGVIITYTIAQFIESYILEPYVVGERVDLNPLMTILVVVVGGAVWGIVGMVISIPLFGILKIVFDRINVLRPLGYTLGEEGIEVGSEESFVEKIARKVKEKIK